MCTCDKDLCCILNELTDQDDDNLKDTFDKEHLCSTSDVQPENTQSSLILVKPSALSFPYNNPKIHTQRLTIWNQTLNFMKIRIKSPDPSIFTLKVDGRGTRTKSGSILQVVLYGLSARCISIKCTPGRHKFSKMSLPIFVYACRDCREICECLYVPLEIYPSTAWFQLPKSIVIPDVVLGRKAHALIVLPQPKVVERFFVTFHPLHTQNAITLSPMHGIIGGDDGIKQLKVTYSPTEYTTVSCTINVHFPGLSVTTAHEIKILARCRPGNEVDLIRKEIAEIESFRPKPTKKIKKHPKLRFKSSKKQDLILDKIVHSTLEHKGTLSLFTLAGVMRFLLSKKDMSIIYKNDEQYSKTAVELLALEVELNDDEKVKIYNTIKKRLGFDFDESESVAKWKLKSHQKRNWDEFQNAVGMALMGKIEQLPMPVEEQYYVQETPRRKSKFVSGSIMEHDDNKRKKSKGEDVLKKHVKRSVSEDEKRMYRSIMADVQLDLSPKQKFVQLVLTVITRRRVDIRLGKIKTLVQQMKGTRRKSSKGSTIKTVTRSGKHSIVGSMKSKSELNNRNPDPQIPTAATRNSKDRKSNTSSNKRKSFLQKSADI